ncbi:carbon-nitrogen hydrolase [Candidatus Micrarchaeota archaeon]|nr:carbon-nitrogen hydrolase [Candidatus Micrarchaeota archaeon]
MKTKIALIQTTASGGVKDNVGRTIKLVEKAAKQGAKIVCLQELFNTHYFPQRTEQADFGYAETIPGPTTNAMAQVAKKNKVYLIVPLFEKKTQGLYYNSVVVLSDKGEQVGHYRKLHIPQDAHSFSEKYFFAEGDLGYVVVDSPYGKIGVLICWDQWYPEAARAVALKGAQFIFYPTAIGWHKNEPKEIAKTQREAWIAMHQSHAIANGVFVAAANRVGVEDDLKFWGASIAVAPSGKILVEGGEKEEILFAECDLKEIEQQRQGWPFLRDRRIDTYHPLLKRFV